MRKTADLSNLPNKRQKKKNLYSDLSPMKKMETCSITHTRPKKNALGFISYYLPVNLKTEQVSALKGRGLGTP